MTDYHGQERRSMDENMTGIFLKVQSMHDLQLKELSSIKFTLQEIHQRQSESVIPTLKKLDDSIFSNDGISNRMTKNEGKIDEIERRVERMPKIIMFVFGALTAIFGIYDYIKKIVK